MHRNKYIITFFMIIIFLTGCGSSETIASQINNDSNEQLDRQAPLTIATPKGGKYTCTQSVMLSCNKSNTTIYYTTDGSLPTEQSSIYVSEINISQTTTLKFFAKDSMGNYEPVKSEEFIIDRSIFSILQKFSISGNELKEASDLALDSEINRLYIVGDKGTLYLYDILVDDINKSINLEYNSEYTIRHATEIFSVDSEGLTIDTNRDLIISLEGVPRISTISSDGVMDNDRVLPPELADSSTYDNQNAMFEAVAYHDQYGILTVAEFPRNHKVRTNQTIYDLNGNRWDFKAEPYVNSAVTGIEVMEDGNIIVLERAQDENDSKYFYITLKKVYINDCNVDNLCRSKVLYNDRIYGQNYEGITKIDTDKYLVVSDNQNYELLGIAVPTYFIYFEVK